MFKIGDFSKICRVPVSALPYYADIGLLEPAHTDKFTSYRYYSLDQLPRLNRILALKDLRLSLEQIAQILRDELPAEQIRGMLRLKQAEIRQQVEERISSPPIWISKSSSRWAARSKTMYRWMVGGSWRRINWPGLTRRPASFTPGITAPCPRLMKRSASGLNPTAIKSPGHRAKCTCARRTKKAGR